MSEVARKTASFGMTRERRSLEPRTKARKTSAASLPVSARVKRAQARESLLSRWTSERQRASRLGGVWASAVAVRSECGSGELAAPFDRKTRHVNRINPRAVAERSNGSCELDDPFERVEPVSSGGFSCSHEPWEPPCTALGGALRS